jgi:hypothetical protein
VVDGPIFKKALEYQIGEKYLQHYEGDGDYDKKFWFLDLKQ